MIAESTVEETALEWLCSLGYVIANGTEIAPGERLAERTSYDQVVLEPRLRDAVRRLNPGVSSDGRNEAIRKVLRTEHPTLVANNRSFHRMFVDGVTVEYRRPDGSIAGAQAQVVDFERPEANDWLAVNQFTVVEGQHDRRPDIVLFVNGLPLAVMELKNARRVATRYDKTADSFLAFIQLASIKIWLRFVNRT